MAQEDSDKRALETILEATAAAIRTAFGTTTRTTVAPPPLCVPQNVVKSHGHFPEPVSEFPRPLRPHVWTLSGSDGAVPFSAVTDADGTTALALEGTIGGARTWKASAT